MLSITEQTPRMKPQDPVSQQRFYGILDLISKTTSIRFLCQSILTDGAGSSPLSSSIR